MNESALSVFESFFVTSIFTKQFFAPTRNFLRLVKGVRHKTPKIYIEQYIETTFDSDITQEKKR